MIAVATGGEGIEAARQQNPDIILMDISLPDMDGLDAARPTGKLTSATGQIEQPDPLAVRDCRSGKL